MRYIKIEHKFLADKMICFLNKAIKKEREDNLMNKKKFSEFYFEGDRNYPDSVYWELYNKNPQEAISKYEGHMYCPLCRKAPITVAKGNERRYLKVDRTDMEKHDIDCSYRLEEGNKKETSDFYQDLDKTDIKNRLVSCMNRMLKEVKAAKVNATPKFSTHVSREKEFLNFTTSSSKKKYLPHKNFTIGTLSDDLDVQKIFYGKCSLYIVQYIPNGENEIKMYYLKVLHRESKKQICDISISTHVYEYLKADFEDIPTNKEEAKDYYLCFSGIMETSKYTYKCKLMDSRLIVVEEDISK